MNKLSRRTFVGSSLAATFTWAPFLPREVKARGTDEKTKRDNPPAIIDTNVNVLEFPFRRLKYGNTAMLVEKLRKHRITEAWAGSFEALLHKNIDGVNARLVDECSVHGGGMLVPFGAVNLAWPDWEEDLRRCHEVYGMRGVRLYPTYQSFDLDHPDFLRFLELAARRKILVQIVGDMEDSRTIHPVVQVGSMNIDALADALKQIPSAKVQLLYWNHQAQGRKLVRLITETNVCFDTSRLESTGGIARMLDGNPWHGFGVTTPLSVERLLFGSHAPYFPAEANVLKLFESPLNLEQMEAIMVNNAERLLRTS